MSEKKSIVVLLRIFVGMEAVLCFEAPVQKESSVQNRKPIPCDVNLTNLSRSIQERIKQISSKEHLAIVNHVLFFMKLLGRSKKCTIHKETGYMYLNSKLEEVLPDLFC